VAIYISFDTETSMRGVGKDPSPFITDNTILCASAVTETNGRQSITEWDWQGLSPKEVVYRTYSKLMEPKDFLIGHNLKFDVQYVAMGLFKYDIVRELTDKTVTNLWNKSNGQWWDTSIAHYILSGQKDTYPSLATSLARYPELSKKDDYLSLFLSLHPEKTTEDCDLRDLLRYCTNDALFTLDLAKLQMQEAIVTGKFALIITMCDALRAITEMEVNGLCVDLYKMEEVKKKYADLSETACFNAFNFISVLGLFEFDFEFNPSTWNSDINKAVYSAAIGSNQSISHLLFGSTKAKEYKVPIAKHKSGNTKWGKFRQKAHDGLIDDPIVRSLILHGVEKSLKTNSFPVDSEMLNKVVSACNDLTQAHMVARALILYREYDKVHSTYLSPLTDMIRGYNTIHHSLKQTSTATGRLSSSNPNFQNQPNNPDVKGVFIPSHTGAHDVFVEFDYKQLEVIAIAYITGDKNLKRDIVAHVDIHSKIGTRVLGHLPSKEERRDIKTIVFAMLYGSGIDNLVATSGKPRALVETIVKEFKTAYPDVFAHHRMTLNMLRATAKATGKTDKDTVHLTSKTGRHYSLPLYRKMEPTGVSYSPSWTQVCNYPCQGFATADIVPMMLAILLDKRDESPYPYRLRNTVHDSILISCDINHVDSVSVFVRRVLENPYPHLNRLFGITDFELPLLVEASSGPNWGDMKPLHF